jgi:aldose sugar dehydrogenase
MKIRYVISAALLGALPLTVSAQGLPPRPLPDTPFTIETAEQGEIRVHAVRGLELPWDMAFLPNGDILVTERQAHRLRIVRNRELLPEPITGLPPMGGAGGGLKSIVIHPNFEENRWIYFTYTKTPSPGHRAAAVARARLDLDGMRLTDVDEFFAMEEAPGGPPPGLPLLFGSDGYLYFGIGGAEDMVAQRGDSYFGKVMRFNDDGTVPENPFAGQEGFYPEIYSIGHRNMIGFAIHPTTGELWQNENGPQGGDEVNILYPGANYGWPLVSYGRHYSGEPVSDRRMMDGMVDPELFWTPSIAISGMVFYTGDRFPNWHHNLFVGGLRFGGINGTGQVQRIVFNDNWQEMRRESLFFDLRQRIRDIDQGPDGLLYVLTDEDEAALLILEPVE